MVGGDDLGWLTEALTLTGSLIGTCETSLYVFAFIGGYINININMNHTALTVPFKSYELILLTPKP